MFERFRKKKPSTPPKRPPERSMEAVLEEFLTLPLPDAIDGLSFRVSMAEGESAHSVSDFERYAARVLDEAGSARIRSIAVEHPLNLIRLDSTGQFWMRFDADTMGADEVDVVLATEAALNRLELVRRKMPQDGEEWIRTNPPERICSLFDWHTLRMVAASAPSYLEREAPDNPLLTIDGVEGLRGGNWDVFTRFALSCEGAVLPYRLTYTYDADAKSGAMVVNAKVPSAAMMPRSRWDQDAAQWLDVAVEQSRAAAAYALRLSTLLAAMAFGTSVGIARVVVNSFDGPFDGRPVLSLEFNRVAFMGQTLPAIASEAFGKPGTESAFDALINLIAPTRFAMAPAPDGTLQPVDPIDAELSDRRMPMSEDERAVPLSLVDKLRADTVADLDVMSEQDKELTEHFRAIMADRGDAPLLAIAQLEELVASTEAKDRELRMGSPDRTPLYCQGVFARYLIGLVTSDPHQRFFRVSDIGYSARTALMQLYLELGDQEGALAQARACVELAPSSPAAYQELTTALVANDDYAGVVEAEKQALRLAVAPDEIAYIYYRLAYAFWRTDQRDLALACYLRVPPFAGVGDMAEAEKAELMAEMGLESADDFERDAVLRAGGVPLAPTTEATELLAETAIRFCEASELLAAAPSVNMLGALRRNDVLSAASLAMRDGA